MLYRREMAPTGKRPDPWAESNERHTGVAGHSDLLAGSLADGLVDRTSGPAERPVGAAGATYFPPAGTSSRRKAWVVRSGVDRRTSDRTDGSRSEGDRRAQRDGTEDAQLAVSEAGVTVLQSTPAPGPVHTRVRRRGHATELRSGRTDLTPAVRRVAERAEEVRRQIAATPWGSDVPVRALLCLTGGSWEVPAPLEIDGVWVGTPELAPAAMGGPVLLNDEQIHHVRELLATPPAELRKRP